MPVTHDAIILHDVQPFWRGLKVYSDYKPVSAAHSTTKARDVRVSVAVVTKPEVVRMKVSVLCESGAMLDLDLGR